MTMPCPCGRVRTARAQHPTSIGLAETGRTPFAPHHLGAWALAVKPYGNSSFHSFLCPASRRGQCRRIVNGLSAARQTAVEHTPLRGSWNRQLGRSTPCHGPTATGIPAGGPVSSRRRAHAQSSSTHYKYRMSLLDGAEHGQGTTARRVSVSQWPATHESNMHERMGGLLTGGPSSGICCQNDSVLVAPDADTRQALQQAHVSVVSTGTCPWRHDHYAPRIVEALPR